MRIVFLFEGEIGVISAFSEFKRADFGHDEVFGCVFDGVHRTALLRAVEDSSESTAKPC